MKLKSVKIENMHNVIEKEYTFDKLTYLHGPNGAGKSTVLQAIQLALLGYIPGDSKQAAAIYRHSRGKAMSVTVVLDNPQGQDVTVTRSFIGSSKSTKSEVDIIPAGYPLESILAELELPVYNFSDFLGLSANKMKDWFLHYLPDSGEQLDLKSTFEENLINVLRCTDMDILNDINALVENVSAELGPHGSGMDIIQKVNTELKAKVSAEKKFAQQLESTMRTLIRYDDCDEDSSEIPELEREYETIQKQIQEYRNYSFAKNQYDKIHENFLSIKSACSDDYSIAKLDQLAIEGAAVNEQYSNTQSKLFNLSKEMSEIKSQISQNQRILASGGSCPYTNCDCFELKERIEAIQEEMKTSNVKYQKLYDECLIVQDELNKLESSKAAINNLRQEIVSYLSKCQTAEEADISAKKLLDECCQGCEDLDESELLTSGNDIQKRILHIRANEQYDKLNDKLTADKFKSDIRLSAYKSLEKLTSSSGPLQNELAEKPFHELENDVDKYLADMFNDSKIKMKFILSDKTNSFDFGLERDGKYISFDLLSSGEKCLYTVALLTCLVDKQDDSKLKVILIDDLLDHLDYCKADALFKSLYNSKTNVQFVLAGVIDCTSCEKDEFVVEVV